MNAEQIAMRLPLPLRKTVILCHSAARADGRMILRAINRIARDKRVSSGAVMLDLISSCWRYGVTPSEFVLLRMAYQDNEIRKSWAGKLLIKELQTRMNTKVVSDLLRDKRDFSYTFADMLGRRVLCLTDSSTEAFEEWLQDLPSRRFVAKPRFDAGGRGVQVIDLVPEIEPGELRAKLLSDDATIVEEYVEQHEDMKRLYPESLNTIRVITVRRNSETEIIGAILRFGVTAKVDNMTAGGRAAAVDIDTGRVRGPAVTLDLEAEFALAMHPVTGVKLLGFQIPMWETVKKFVLTAANLVPEAGTVGWDVAISRQGPVLIEGNADWGLLLWQLPGEKGYKPLVEELLRNV